MKYLVFISVLISIGVFFFTGMAHGAQPIPEINCFGLPGCEDGKSNAENVEGTAASIVALLIQYVAVFAVIALMCSGILYMLSSGEEEKTKKAKNWIIRSMVAVVLSMSGYYIISVINNIEL